MRELQVKSVPSIMLNQKYFYLCLVATFALQVLFASAGPVQVQTPDAEDANGNLVKPAEEQDAVDNLDTRGLLSWFSGSNSGLTEGQKATEENVKNIKKNFPNAKFNTGNVPTLSTRGLFDYVSSPTSILGDGAKAVDDTVRGIGNTGIRAARNTAGLGVQAATGINPNTFIDMPREALKTAIHGVQYGTSAAFDTTDRALDTIQGLHDKKKQLIDDYVKPYTPETVNSGIDRVNQAFDSSMATIKDRMRNGRDLALEKLADYEKRIEEGGNLLPSSLGIAEMGKTMQNGANTLLGFYGLGGAAGATGIAGEAANTIRNLLPGPTIPASQNTVTELPVSAPAPVSPPAPVIPPVMNPVVAAPAAASVVNPMRPRPGYRRVQRVRRA